jgi:uncharacterized protein YggU (UPF0235/DUF167 family)
LAETFGCKRTQVELVSGSTSRSKRIKVTGVDASTAVAMLDALLDKPSMR